MDKTILINVKTLKKCQICKRYFSLEEEIGNIVLKTVGKKNKTDEFYHADCLKKQMLSNKRLKLNKDDIDIIMQDLILDCGKKIDYILYRNHLYQYLMSQYKVVSFTKPFYMKMEDIFRGRHKGMAEGFGVPPEHLLDMFRRKEKSKEIMANYRNLAGQDKVNYDLAIVLHDYPNYLLWLAKKETDDKRIAEQILEEKPDMNNVIAISRKVEKKEEENIFSDIAD